MLHFVLHSVSKWCNMSRYSHMCSDNQKAGNPHKQGVSWEYSKYAGLREMKLYGFESRLALNNYYGNPLKHWVLRDFSLRWMIYEVEKGQSDVQMQTKALRAVSAWLVWENCCAAYQCIKCLRPSWMREWGWSELVFISFGTYLRCFLAVEAET